jgi:hypothetical protein
MLYEVYMQKVDEIVEECDWVTSMGPREIVNLISCILEDTPVLIESNQIGSTQLQQYVDAHNRQLEMIIALRKRIYDLELELISPKE